MPVQQSGSITPGHLVKWVTDGVVGDAGPAAGLPVLAQLLNADFNSIEDQPILFPSGMTALQITGIVITNASMSLSVAAGGFYPEAAKGGTAIVAAGQSYSALTSATVLMLATLAANQATTRFSSANLDTIDGLLAMYLSLSTAQGVAATADVYILGTDLSA